MCYFRRIVIDKIGDIMLEGVNILLKEVGGEWVRLLFWRRRLRFGDLEEVGEEVGKAILGWE